MRYLLALCASILASGCGSVTRTAVEAPAKSALRSPTELSGTYANRGLCHSPDEYHAVEAYLEVVVGLSRNPSQQQGGSFLIRANEDTLTFSCYDAGQILHEKTLKRNLDYKVTDSGVEFTTISEGPGGEGHLSMKVTRRLLLGLDREGTIIIRVHEDSKGIGGIFFPLPETDSRELWYEFKKENGQTVHSL